MDQADLDVYKSISPAQRAEIDSIQADTEYHTKKKLAFGAALVTMIAIFAVFL
jgi:hypothetical protein